MRRQIKRVVATLLTASLIAPMCYGNKVSNGEKECYSNCS